MHLKSLVKRNLAEGILVFAGAFVLIAQFLLQKYFLSDGGLNYSNIVGVPLDDVYIHCRYAANLLSGNGYAFDPGHILSADTSPLWVALIAIGGLFTSHLDVVAVVLSSLFYLLLAPAVYRICRFTLNLSHSWSILGGFVTLLSSRLVWASTSGMEISLASFVALAILYEHVSQREAHGTIRFREGAFLALGIAVRPELMFIAAICFIDWFLISIRERKGFGKLVAVVVVFLFGVAPVFLIPYSERGSFIYHSSVVQGARLSFVPDIGYLWFVCKVFAASFSIPVAIAFLSPFMLRGKIKLTVFKLFAFGLPLLLAFVAPQFRHHGRYFFPIFPVLIILGIAVLEKIFSTPRWTKYIPMFRVILIAAAIFGAARGSLLSAESARNINDQHLAAAIWVTKNVGTGERIAVDDVGAIGYFTQRKLVDLTGLMSPEIFPLQHDQRLVWNEARRQGATIFIIYTRLNPSFYEFAKDSLEMVKEFRVSPPLVASADTVMSIFRVRESANATR
ncbi:MAG: hypothetical protein ABI778_02290 [Ignavibacteriota bacterium]